MLSREPLFDSIYSEHLCGGNGQSITETYFLAFQYPCSYKINITHINHTPPDLIVILVINF